MFCPNCGTSVPDGSKFCESCGSSMNHSEETEEKLQEPILQQPQYQPPPQQPVPQQQTQHQQQYQPMPQPAQFNSNNVQINADPREKVYGVGGWLLTFLLLCIPFVNIILVFVWAFSGNVNKNKKNFAIAYIIMMVIMIAISIVLYASIAAMIGNLLDQLGGGFGEFGDLGNGFVFPD